jgi:hypothetical protein
MASKRPDEMTEEELARFYEERKGDLSLWAKDAAAIRRRRGGPSTVFAVRFTPRNWNPCKRRRNVGTTTSDFIRTAALQAATGSDDSTVSTRLLSEAVEQVQQSVASLRRAHASAGERPLRPSAPPDGSAITSSARFLG